MTKAYPTYAAALAVARKRPGEHRIVLDQWIGTFHAIPLQGAAHCAHPLQVLATVEYEKGA